MRRGLKNAPIIIQLKNYNIISLSKVKHSQILLKFISNNTYNEPLLVFIRRLMG